MTELWVRVKADIADEPRFIQAGPVAAWLWLAGLGYARLKLTDGFIPRAKVAGLVPGLKGAHRHAQRLVQAGLWFPKEGGYVIRDFLEWNPSREDVKGALNKDAARKRRERLSRRASGESSEVSPPGHDPDPSRGGAQAPLPSDSASGDLAAETESDLDTAPPRWNDGPVGHSRGALARAHPRCDPAAVLACRHGLCVPGFLVEQWRAQLDPSQSSRLEADAAIGRFVAAAVAALPPGPIGDDPLRFWRAAWSAAHGTVAPAQQGKAASTRAAVQRVLRRRAEAGS